MRNALVLIIGLMVVLSTHAAEQSGSVSGATTEQKLPDDVRKAALMVHSGQRAEGLKELELLAEGGSVEAEYARGVFAYPDLDDGAKWLIRAAEHGHAKAMFTLSSIYRFGQGVPKDIAKANAYLKSAVEKKDMSATFDYGCRLIEGRDFPPDEAAGLTYLISSAEMGLLSGQFKLGQMYEKGDHVPKDEAKAFSYYFDASKHRDAMFAYGELGRCYEYGIGTNKNLDEAIKWYRKAANEENAFAASALKRLGVR